MYQKLWIEMKDFYKTFLKPYQDLFLSVLSFLAHCASVFVIVTFIIEYGFQLDDGLHNWTDHIYYWCFLCIMMDRGFHLFIQKSKYYKTRFTWLGICINSLLVISFLSFVCYLLGFSRESGILAFIDDFSDIILFVVSLLDFSDILTRSLGQKTNPSLILSASFLLFIFLGSGLLLMPVSLQPGVYVSWIDTLFTATSAVCVTGLSTVDITEIFSKNGQFLILVLIQIGGLGIMTITSFFALFFMGNTSLYSQMVVRDMVSADSLSGLFSLLKNVFGFTFLIELVGAACIFFSIHGDLGQSIPQELWFSVFHSISAFCNAGFSNVPKGLANSHLMHNQSLLWIMGFIIILGSIGYPILVNFKTIIYKHLQTIWRVMHGRYYVSLSIPGLFNVNTKIVLAATSVLIVIGMVFLGLFEWNGSLGGMSFGEKMSHLFFNSVSPRTAGFETVDLNLMCPQAMMVYMFLMWVGGASQSTAGGVKVNTLVACALNLKAIITGTERVCVFHREIPYESIRRANAVVLASFILLTGGVFLLSYLEPTVSLSSLAFECISALSTVGSSLDVTQRLGINGKILIMCLMFIGRVGAITLAQSLINSQKTNHYKLPEENIIIS